MNPTPTVLLVFGFIKINAPFDLFKSNIIVRWIILINIIFCKIKILKRSYLKRIVFVVDGGGIGFEVDSNGGEVGCVELWLAESEENGAFSDSLRTNYDNFKCS